MNIAYSSIAVAWYVVSWLFTRFPWRMNIAYHSIAVALFVLSWLFTKLSWRVESGESISKTSL